MPPRNAGPGGGGRVWGAVAAWEEEGPPPRTIGPREEEGAAVTGPALTRREGEAAAPGRRKGPPPCQRHPREEERGAARQERRPGRRSAFIPWMQDASFAATAQWMFARNSHARSAFHIQVIGCLSSRMMFFWSQVKLSFV